MTDCFQVTYSRAWEEAGNEAIHSLLRVDERRMDYLVQ